MFKFVTVALLATSAAGFGTHAAMGRRCLCMSTNEPKPPKGAMEKQIAQGLKAGAVFGSVIMQQAAANAADEEDGEGAAAAADPFAGYITTGSGLKYKDTKVGEGAAPAGGDTVRVHYTGWLDGFESPKKFDSSYDRRSPLVFKAGVGQVVKGWDEALLTDMKVGTVRNVILPPELGYGARGAGGVIPPNATLYFKMELVGIGAR